MPRPRVNLDPRTVEAYTRLGCPLGEIAEILGVSISRLRPIQKELQKARASRHLMLRQFQWTQAKDGSVPMLMFLGKLELGQTEEQLGREDRMIVRRMVKRS